MKCTVALVALAFALVAVKYIDSQNNFHFFGAKVDSEYIMHYNGKLQCAYIIGWYDDRKCVCFLTEPDPRLKDKTLIASDPIMCVDAE